MKVWNGTMIADEFTADVQVYDIKPNGSTFREWYGNGIVKSSKSFEPKEYQTNLGKIIITRLSYNADGITFDFQGSGKPNL